MTGRLLPRFDLFRRWTSAILTRHATDYNDLYAFNFGAPIPAEEAREPIDTKEAIRLIQLKLRVTKIEAPGEDDGQDSPVVTFKGTSRSLHASWDVNANSRIRGEWRSDYFKKCRRVRLTVTI